MVTPAFENCVCAAFHVQALAAAAASAEQENKRALARKVVIEKRKEDAERRAAMAERKEEEDRALAARIHEQQEEERRKAERCAPNSMPPSGQRCACLRCAVAQQLWVALQNVESLCVRPNVWQAKPFARVRHGQLERD